MLKIHIRNLSGKDIKTMLLKFCTPDRFIIKDFTLMNSNIDHLHSYAQKYRHFLLKFQYYRGYQRQEQYILFFDKKKSSTKKYQSLLRIFPPNLQSSMKRMSKNRSYSYLVCIYSLTVPILENPHGFGPYRGLGTRVNRTIRSLYKRLGRGWS